MLETLTLRAGPSLETAPVVLQSPRVVVFVGPNNSGKSLLLQEIFLTCRDGPREAKVLGSLNFSSMDQARAEGELARVTSRPRPGETPPEGHRIIEIDGQ